VGSATRAVGALPGAWLAFFFVIPLCFTIVYAFAHAGFGTTTLGFTLENFRDALTGFNLRVFLRTLQFAVVGTLLCAVVAAPLAYFLARKAGRFAPVLIVLVLIPYFTSFLIRTLAWRTILDDRGPIADALAFLGLHHGPIHLLDAPPAVFIGVVYAYLPLMTLPLYVAFLRIPDSVLEASRDLGAGRIRTFLSVTLPLARPGVATGALLTAVPMTGEYVVPALLGGSKGVLMGGLIASQYLEVQNIPLGSAMAVMTLGVLGIAVFLLIRATRGFDEVAS
jgi:ABC-type spermidine/putrescine transport system permease subunit I